MAAQPGRVAIMGAGPGDPGLLTLRGQQLLDAADVVVYERLVHPSLVEGKATVVTDWVPVPPRRGMRRGHPLHPGTHPRGVLRPWGRADLRVAGGRRHQRGRVLGVAQHRLPPAPPRPVRGGRQRLRHLGAIRGPVTRADFRDGAGVPGPGGDHGRRARLPPVPSSGGEGREPGAGGGGAGADPRSGDPALLALGGRYPVEVPVRRRTRRGARPRPGFRRGPLPSRGSP